MAIKIMPNWYAPYINKVNTLILKNGRTKEARIVIDTVVKKTGYRFQTLNILFDIYDNRYNEALIKTELSDPSEFSDHGDNLLLYALIHSHLDHTDLAKAYYDSARVFYIRKLQEDHENSSTYRQIGYAYAGLKDLENAANAGEKAVQLTTDVLDRNDMQIDLARIYMIAGDYKNSLKQVVELLKMPTNISIKLLLLDPVWKPINDTPEFKKIIQDYSRN